MFTMYNNARSVINLDQIESMFAQTDRHGRETFAIGLKSGISREVNQEEYIMVFEALKKSGLIYKKEE